MGRECLGSVGAVAMWTPKGSPVCCRCLRWVEPRFWWCKLQVLIEQLGFWLAVVVKTPVLFWKLARMDILTIRGTDSFAPLMTGCVDHIDSLQNLLEKGAGSIHFRLAKYLCWSPLFNDDSLIGEEHLVRDLTCEGHFVSHQDGS